MMKTIKGQRIGKYSGMVRREGMADTGLGLYISNSRMIQGISKTELIKQMKESNNADLVNMDRMTKWEANLAVPSQNQLVQLSELLGLDLTLLKQLTKNLQCAMNEGRLSAFVSKRDRENMEITRRLKQRRLKLKMSQKEVAELLYKEKVSIRSIERLRRIENGKKRIGNNLLSKLAEIYGVDEEYFNINSKFYETYNKCGFKY